ncbi:MAG: acetate/propionate family kinase [Rhodomicrobium sp.]
MDTILVTNAGSSSVKFEVFGIDQAGGLSSQLEGKIEGVGTKPHLTAKSAEGKVLVERTYTNETVSHVSAALHAAGGWLRDERHIHPIAVGHRVVHGGPEFDQPVIVTEEVLQRLERYIPLAPLHQPHNLAPIRSIMLNQPGLPQVACFDTAFHRKHPAVADYYAIPEHFHAEGIRRYGFHGLSYEYIAARLPAVAPDVAKKKIIVAHLGSGASMCALNDGQSIESTMGFTALDGLPMGTRAGQIDPGVVLYLIEQKGMSPREAQRLLYHDCGLKGLSGISNDMRELEASSDPRAAFAIDYFVYRISLFTGALAAALGGLDAFVFTAGIGENSASLRARVASKLSWLGVRLDEAANAGRNQLISAPDSAVAVYVIPTDEELMIARHTLALVRGH